MSTWEETQGQIQDTEGLYVPDGLGLPWVPLEFIGGNHWGEGCLGYSGFPVTTVTLTG